MMSDPRSLLERESRRFIQQDGAFERLVRRRDRKRRNQRIAAGVVGIAVFVAAVWIVTSGLSLDRSDSSVVPAEDGTAPAVKAQPAAAVDEGFRGRYRVIALGGGCSFQPSRYRVRIRYVSERVRSLNRYASGHASGPVRPLRYVRGKYFPWQRQGGRLLELRYDPRTDTAIGVQQAPECPIWHVRLVPIG
jgi:hypothetical protein